MGRYALPGDTLTTALGHSSSPLSSITHKKIGSTIERLEIHDQIMGELINCLG